MALSSPIAVLRPAQGWQNLAVFLGITLQLGLLLVLIQVLHIEVGSRLARILPLVFAGFLVHASLPLRFRQQFFLLLSFAAIGLVLGIGPGLVLIALGLGLIGLCHLPVTFSLRIALLVVAGGALAALRSWWEPAALQSPSSFALPRFVPAVLGSMFMFRIIIYLYDLFHEERDRAGGKPVTKPAVSVWARLSYFFLLPNVCFPLFPVVDYQTYLRTYYNTRSAAIYRRGVWWMSLGLWYILMYRLVYHYLVPSPEQIRGLGGVVRFMVSSYLVYFHVVGQFYLIIGLLCLFGFNLPPAHRYFLLATGFTDFWRRARIDWKDFMVKVFYYPALVPLQRRWETIPALVAATVGVFVATLLLHSYQWFWLKGDIRLTNADAVFWTVIGSCVLANSLLEMRKRKRRVTGGLTLGNSTVQALKIAGMFVFMSVLWSYWVSPSFHDWLSIVSASSESGPASYALLVGILAVVIGMIAVIQFLWAKQGARPAMEVRASRPGINSSRAPRSVQMLASAMPLALLLVMRLPFAQTESDSTWGAILINLSSDRLNATDRQKQDLGYYEKLLDVPQSSASELASGAGQIDRVNVQAAQATGASPASEAAKETALVPITQTDVVRRTYDMLRYELKPSYSGIYRDKPFQTNRWGMRDKEYALVPPSGTYRIALLGTSYEMASGVKMEEGLDWLVEDQLNREGPGVPRRHYEILNFSVAGYEAMQYVILAEHKIFAFSPDAVILTLHPNDATRVLDDLVVMVKYMRAPIPYEYLRQKIRESGAVPEMEIPELRRRLEPVSVDALDWSVERIATLCRERGVPAVALMVPRVEAVPEDALQLARRATAASSAGFRVINLEGVFDGKEVDSIRVAPNDGHPNALGHRLLADRLFEQLRQDDERLLRLGFIRQR